MLQAQQMHPQTQAALRLPRACRTLRTDMDLLTMPSCCQLSAGTPASVTLPDSCSRGGSHSPLMRDRRIPKGQILPPFSHHPLILIPEKRLRLASSNDLYSWDLLKTVGFDILHKSLYSSHRLLHLPYCSPPLCVQPCHAAPSTGVISHGEQVCTQ